MRNLIFLLVLLAAYVNIDAQEIYGTVVDATKQPLPSTVVAIMQNSIVKGAVVTDFDGNYSIKPLDTGHYTLRVTYTGLDTQIVSNVLVTNIRTRIDFMMTTCNKQLSEVMVHCYKAPISADADEPSIYRLEKREIDKIPTTEVNDMLATSTQVIRKRGAADNVGGARGSGVLYIIDGVQVQGAVNSALPSPPVAQFYDPSTESYKRTPENDFMNVKANPLSTMSVDVDGASYTNVRRFISSGQMPPADAVRIEELVNYFHYTYPQPAGKDPIAIATELTDCPWQAGHKLLHIGMRAATVDKAGLPPSNLVFLIDVSGSMESAERLPLLVAGMKLLAAELRPQDKVAIVTYAGNAGLALPPAAGSDKRTITDALDRLQAGGSTAGGEGIALAYKVAKENFIKGGNNRVLLATDGDFNIGISNENDLEDLIVKERETGVYLTCLGFGTDNYKDSKMELLADKGNGNYNYIENIQDAQKTLVSEFGGTLFTVAKDVKSQIEFNPAKVQAYRLVGYENRLLNTEDFKDDKKDAGDMGSGHVVTIIYELIPTGMDSKYVRETNDLKYQQAGAMPAAYSDELATIKCRYKQPDGNVSAEMKHTVADNTISWGDASENTRFSYSVAMFGLLLKGSKYKGTSSYSKVEQLAKGASADDKEGYRAGFISMVGAARKIDRRSKW